MRTPLVLLLAIATNTVFAQAEPPQGEPVVVVNTPNINIQSQSNPLELIGPMFRPDELISENFRLRTPPGAGKDSRSVTFQPPNGEPIRLRDISFALGDKPMSGSCQTKVFVNQTLIKIMGEGGSGGFQPPSGMPVIDLSPNDVVTLQLEAVNTDKNEKGACEAEFVVLVECRT